MRELKILHTSDLLLGTTENDAAFDSIAERIKDLTGYVDYLVIAGNLTVDGQPKSFEAAEKALATFAKAILRPDDDRVIRRNRVLLVPGRRDTQNGTSYKAFKNFHDGFFATEIAQKPPRVEKFDPTVGIFRGLKYISLIGLGYWRQKPSEIGDLVAQVHNATGRRLSSVEYASRTPTLVVSAEQVMFDGSPELEGYFKGVRSDLRQWFRKAVHLFGSNGTNSSPSPRTLDMLGFGTGPKRDGGFWPFTANVMTLRESSIDDDPGEPCYRLSNTVLEQIGPYSSIQAHRNIHGELDLLYDREARASRSDTFKKLLGIIESELRQHSQLILRGFPGAGKLPFYEFIQKRTVLLTQKIDVLPIRLEKGDRITDRVKEMRAFREHPYRAQDVMPIIVIHDARRLTLTGEQKAELRVLDTFFPTEQWVLLLQPDDNYTVDDVAHINRDRTIPFPCLDLDAETNLVKEFSAEVPATGVEVNNITGGYAGFSVMLLKGARSSFERGSGAEPLHQDMTTALLDHAIEAQDIIDESRWHRDLIMRKNSGAYICEYIMDEVEEKRRTEKLNSIRPIEIDVGELKARTAPLKRDSVDGDLKNLCHAGILGERFLRGDKAFYPVQVLVPFVTPGRSPREGQEPDRSEDDWPMVEDDDRNLPIDFVILTALPEERDAVLLKLRSRLTLNPEEGETLRYVLAKVPVTFPEDKRQGAYRVIVTNVPRPGQVGAAVAAARVIERWKPRGILLVGIAGGVKQNGVALGDLIVSDQVAYYEASKATPEKLEIRWQMIPVDPTLYNCSQWVRAEAAIARLDIARPGDGEPVLHHDSVATGETVVANEDLLRTYVDVLPKLVGVETEAWGVATAAFQAGNPRKFLMIRGVSDHADADKDRPEVKSWRAYACDIAASYAIEFLRSAPLPESGD